MILTLLVVERARRHPSPNFSTKPPLSVPATTRRAWRTQWKDQSLNFTDVLGRRFNADKWLIFSIPDPKCPVGNMNLGTIGYGRSSTGLD